MFIRERETETDRQTDRDREIILTLGSTKRKGENALLASFLVFVPAEVKISAAPCFFRGILIALDTHNRRL